MTAEEKLKIYEELVRKIVVHADSFGDVHWYITQMIHDNPELKEDAPWFN